MFHWWGVAVYFFALCGFCFIISRLLQLIPKNQYDKPFLTLLLVVKNQEAVIEGVMREIFGLRQANLPYFEVVVVDDGSSDQTPDILQRITRDHNDFILLRFNRQDGVETPLELGAYYAVGELICYLNLTRKIKLKVITELVAQALRGENNKYPSHYCAITFIRRDKLVKQMKS